MLGEGRCLLVRIMSSSAPHSLAIAATWWSMIVCQKCLSGIQNLAQALLNWLHQIAQRYLRLWSSLMIDRRGCLIWIDLNLLWGLLLDVLALISFDNHFRLVYTDITSRIDWRIYLHLIVVEIIHELLQLTVRIVPLMVVMQMIWWVIFHSLVLRTCQVRWALLLLLCLICRLNERLRCRETISGGIKADIDFVIRHREVREIHLDHVVAKTAFFRQLVQLIFVFLLEVLHLLLHLLQCQIQLLI